MSHDHFVPQRGQQPAHPGRMRPRLHRDATPRHATEYLFHGFRCGCQFVLQNDFSCFIQNAVSTGAISQIQFNGELPLENVFPTHACSANLLHCRSPFLCASSTSNIGSVSHPAETGLLIPSDKPCQLKWSMQHSSSPDPTMLLLHETVLGDQVSDDELVLRRPSETTPETGKVPCAEIQLWR